MATTPFPSFTKPPVSEVVLGASFRPSAASEGPLLGLVDLFEFWRTELRSQFPDIEERAPYEPPVEVLDRPQGGPRFSFGLGELPAPRLWAFSSDRTGVVQLQRDWFAVNWSRLETDTQYRRFPSARQRFFDQFSKFNRFLGERAGQEPLARQCELTYVNRIEPNDVWQNHGQFDRVIRLAGRPAGVFLATESLETMQVTATGIMRDTEGAPRGRLHISARPVFRDVAGERRPEIMLTLTARGEPLTPDAGGLGAFFDLGHEWIVKSFVDVTTEAMHTAWGRYE